MKLDIIYVDSQEGEAQLRKKENAIVAMKKLIRSKGGKSSEGFYIEDGKDARSINEND